VDEIRIPSERSFRERARALREGIEIDRKIYEALKAVPEGRLPEL
jgi:LDH2 family malate/lactate/ureidoglycolate dehydrogenase